MPVPMTRSLFTIPVYGQPLALTSIQTPLRMSAWTKSRSGFGDGCAESGDAFYGILADMAQISWRASLV